MDWIRDLNASVAAPLLNLFSPVERIYIPYLLTSVALAVWVYVRRPPRGDGPTFVGFFRYCFPKAIYGHKSAIMDCIYYVVYRPLFLFLLAPLLLSEHSVAGWSKAILSGVHAPLSWSLSDPWAASVVFTVINFVFADFGIFLAHYIMHRVPFFWEFHKLHHSAEVMMPMTVYRTHPVDDILAAVLVSACAGVTTGLWIYWFDHPGVAITVMGANVLTLVHYVFGYNLRHSHVWLDFGRAADHILISPAQHQIHHSTAPEHADKNLGFVFSVWDWMFGTLIVPDGPMEIEFGLWHGEDAEYQSLKSMFFLPFRKSAKLLRSGRAFG